MKPIIIATDFSAASLNAASYAADMALVLNLPLIIAHVIEIPSTAFQVPITEVEFNSIEDSAKTGLAELQKKLQQRVNGKIDVSTELLYGTVQFELEKFAGEKKPFALVTGSKVQSGIERFVLGSNVLRLVHHMHYPLLIVPQHVSFKGIRYISIASDLTNTDDDIPWIGFVKKWLSAFHISPDIVHIVPDGKEKYDTSAGVAFLKNSLAAYNPKFHFITDKKTENGLNSFFQSHLADLLIVMPGKHGFFESMFTQSISSEVILHTQMPVLSVFQSEQNVLRKMGNRHERRNH
ncbi:MAG: universal stress protein, partial [Bacteroidota bacterium]